MGLLGSLAVLSVGCSSSAGTSPKTTTTHPPSVLASITDAPSTRAEASPSSASGSVPKDVERIARAFVAAYAERDARDGKDRSYADAGARAARLATPELGNVLAQKRQSQDAVWARMRAEKVQQKAKITSTVVPDGAPAATASSALVRVGYTLTATPKSGQARHTAEQLALRLERTRAGWRVTALPWA